MSKKCLFTWGVYSLFSGVALFAMHLFLLLQINKWVGVSIGGAVLLFSLIIFVVLSVKKKGLSSSPAMLCAFTAVNSLASGVAMSSLFTHFSFVPSPLLTLAFWAAGVFLFFLFSLFTHFSVLSNKPYLWIAGYLLLLLAGCIAGVCFFKIFWVGILLFVLFAAFLLMLAVPSFDRSEQAFNLTVASYAALLFVVLSVLLVLSEGDLDLSADLPLSPSATTPYRYSSEQLPLK